MRKLILIALPILFVLSIIAFAGLYYLPDTNEIYDNGVIILWSSFVLLALGAIFIQGSFRKIWWCRIAYFGVVAFIMGLVFKLLHWPGATVLILSGSGTVGIIYLIHFFAKRNKRLLDWIKLVYVQILLMSILSSFFHLGYEQELLMMVFVSAMTMFTTFYILTLRGNISSPVELSQEGSDIFRYEERD